MHGDVQSSRKLNPGEHWVYTGLKRLATWIMTECTAKPFYNSTTGARAVIAASTDTIIAYKATVLSEKTCEVGPASIFTLPLLSGKIDGEYCWIKAAEDVTLIIDSQLCE